MARIRVAFSIGAMHGGGSERQVVTILRHLDRTAFEPFLYLVYRTGPLLDQVPADVPITAFSERVPPVRLWWPGRAHQQRVHDMERYFREIRADISYDRTFLMTLIAADAAQRIGLPNVSTIVTNPEHGFAPVAGRFQAIKRRRLRRLYRQSSRVLAVSDGARLGAARFYDLPADRITTLRNGIDLNALLLEANEAPVQDSWWNADGSSVFRLVSAGRLNHAKGFHLLIDAVARLRTRSPKAEVRLALLGDGEGRERLQVQIDQLGLTSAVRLCGFEKNAAAWYRSANVFVLPSLVEGMPNVLLEAMALGTPVVSFDCESGPAEILEGGRLGELITPGDTKALADGIERVIRNPDAMRRRAESARRIVCEQYSANAVVKSLESILQGVVQQRLRS